MKKLRLFFASDLHGSDLCFRKFIGAARAFRADAVVLGGDLTGKALVPIVRGSSVYRIYLDHEPVTVQSEGALIEAERALNDSGRYTVRLEPDEIDGYLANEDRQQRFLRQAAVQQVRRWAQDAERVLSPLGVECYIMAGNDDEPDIVEALTASRFVVNHDERIVYVRDAVPLVGLGSSNLTPFRSPRELPEAEIAERLDRLLGQLPEPSQAILNAHCPPFGTGLDFAPEIGPDKELISYGGQPRMVPVGSTAVLDAIRRYQPLVGLHGHCHDSKHRCRIGVSTCINPGSLCAEGALAGAIIDLAGSKRVSCQFVNG